MLDKVNANITPNIQVEPTLKQGKLKEAGQSSQAQQVTGIFKRCLGMIRATNQKTEDNQDCHDHSVGMRHSAAKVSEAALPLFTKLKNFVAKQAENLTQNRVIRKLKDLLGALETIDFNYVRSSEIPVLIDSMAQALAELALRYKDFEEQKKDLEEEEFRTRLKELLASIAKIPFKEDKFHLRNALAGEIITKYWVSRPVGEEDEIALPCFKDQNPCVVLYRLNKQMELGESGIPVLTYAPSEEQDRAYFSPLLLFRGTRINFSKASDVRSIVENLHRIGPAREIYEQFKGTLGAFFKEWFHEGPMAESPHFRVMGYSQGAVLGQRALVDFYPYFERRPLQESLLFNSPALELDYYQTWEEIPAGQKPATYIYLVINDIVSKRGHRFASETIFEIKPRSPKKWLGAHLGSKFIDPEWEIFQVDNTKEGESASRKLVNQLCSSSSVEMIYNSLAPRFRFRSAAKSTKRPSRVLPPTRRKG